MVSNIIGLVWVLVNLVLDKHGFILAGHKLVWGMLVFPGPQVDVDLLMEPTKDFPGIIAPKVRGGGGQQQTISHLEILSI